MTTVKHYDFYLALAAHSPSYVKVNILSNYDFRMSKAALSLYFILQLHSSQADLFSGVRQCHFKSEISRFRCEIMMQTKPMT